jgi:Raf kinase inhibitor-like YbhB/YbcL family protein
MKGRANRPIIWFLLISWIAHLSGCGKNADAPKLRSLQKEVPNMELTSDAFKENETVPTKHTADGADLSPSLKWQGAPRSTKSFALICDDPDAPRPVPWVHWVIFNIPAEKKELPEGVAKSGKLPDGALQGSNDFGKTGYGGPSPPPGKPHRYFFRIYALDQMLSLKEGCTRKDLEKAMSGHVLAQGQLMGKYER